MSDTEHLLVLFGCLFLIECCFWIRPGTFVFSTQFGWGHRRASLRWALLRNVHGGVLIGNLTPLGRSYVCQQWPISLSPTGVYGYVGQALSTDGRPNCPERFVRYEDIRRVGLDRKEILINGRAFAKSATEVFGRELVELIRRLQALPEAERAAAIGAALARHFDPAGVRARLDECRRETRDLRVYCCLLLFVVMLYPTLVVAIVALITWGVVLSSYALILPMVLLRFISGHRRLYPKEHGERRMGIFMTLVSPIDAIHACDRLGRNVLATHHPLAVARVLSSREDFVEFLADAWRDLEHPMLPICPSDEPGPTETEAWFRALLRTEVERLAQSAEVPLAPFLTVPSPESAECRSYCPRCLGQYLQLEGECLHCGGRPLAPLPTA
jgi:hypothetical protein